MLGLMAGRRILDLSVTLDSEVPADPPGLGPNIDYMDHAGGAAEMEEVFGVPVDKQLEGCGPAAERVQMTTHNGTHMDAPWHYHPTMDGGKPAMRVDEIPLEWCVGQGVKLDFRALPDGHVVSAGEVEAELARIGYELKPGDIVLVNTSAGAKYGQPDYVNSGCGMGREATLWLVERGVRLCGTDGWSWDPPLAFQVARARETGDYSLFWEGHKAGADCVYCHMEKLANLEQLPATGFEVIAMPVKVARASAGWCRPVALLPV